MTALLAPAAAPPLPSSGARWQEWVAYGLRWASVVERAPVVEPVKTTSRTLTLHAYREAEPGPRWRALYDATWPAYRRWYTREGLAARPSLDECRRALSQYLPELMPTWERLCRLSGDDPVAARMLSMWGLPAFAVGCSQVVIPGEQPVLIRNYDYDQSLFEAIVASTNYSGHRRVLGTSDLLWGLLDGMNEDGLAISLTFGGRPGDGEGFGIPIVLRYVLETCATVEQAVSRTPSDSCRAVLQRGPGRHNWQSRHGFCRPGPACRSEPTRRDDEPPTRSGRIPRYCRQIEQCRATCAVGPVAGRRRFR